MNTFIAVPYNNEVNVILPLLDNSSELLLPLNYYGQILNQGTNIESQAYSQNTENELASTLFKKQTDYWGCFLNPQKVSWYTREGNGISIPNSPIFNQDYVANNWFPVSYANYQQKYVPVGFNQAGYNSLTRDEDEDSQSVRISFALKYWSLQNLNSYLLLLLINLLFVTLLIYKIIKGNRLHRSSGVVKSKYWLKVIHNIIIAMSKPRIFKSLINILFLKFSIIKF